MNQWKEKQAQRKEDEQDFLDNYENVQVVSLPEVNDEAEDDKFLAYENEYWKNIKHSRSHLKTTAKKISAMHVSLKLMHKSFFAIFA